MPNDLDLIRRGDAKAAIEKLHAEVKAQLMAEDDSYKQVLIKRRLRGIQQALAAVLDVPALDAIPAAEGEGKRFFAYIEQESNRSGLPPIAVLANEWAAHQKLKDESLWPSDADLAASSWIDNEPEKVRTGR